MIKCGSVSPQPHHHEAVCDRGVGHPDLHIQHWPMGGFCFWTDEDVQRAHVRELEQALPDQVHAILVSDSKAKLDQIGYLVTVVKNARYGLSP